MKKKTVLFLLTVFAFALAAAPVLTSCSDDEGNDDPGFGSPEKLAAPTNIRLDEAERTLRWDAVPHAASYTIYRNLLGGLAAPAAEGAKALGSSTSVTVTTNSYPLTEADYDAWHTWYIVANPPANSPQYEASDYAITPTFVCPVNKQLLATPSDSSFTYQIMSVDSASGNPNVRFFWDEVPEALNYTCVVAASDSGFSSTSKRVTSNTYVDFRLHFGRVYTVSLTANPDNTGEWIESATLRKRLTMPAANGSEAPKE